MAKEQLIIELIAESKNAVKNLKNYTNAAKQSADRVGKLTKLIKGYFAEITAGILIARKMINITKDLIKAYTDQEVAESKLTAALKATGRWSLEAEESLHAFATEMQMSTGIGDDLIIAAEGIMTTFTQISTKTFPEALEAAANMSTMFGQDLQQSVIQLGTALNDPIMGVGRLKRIGISFSEDQKKSIEMFMKQNNIMAAQRVILDELQLEIGGVAKAYGQTLAGKQAIVNEQFGELKEQLGFLVSQNMPAFLDLTSVVISKMSSWIGTIIGARQEVENFRKSLSGLTVVELKEVIKGQDAYIDDLVKTIKPIQDEMEAIENLTKTRREDRKRLKELKEQYDEIIPTYDTALVQMNDFRTELVAAEKREKMMGLAAEGTTAVITEQEKVVSQLSDKWTRWAEIMQGATDEAIAFNTVAKTTQDIIEDMQDPLELHRQKFAEIERQLDFTFCYF